MKALKILFGLLVLALALGLVGLAYAEAGGMHGWGGFNPDRMFEGDGATCMMGAGACLMLLFAMVFPCRGGKAVGETRS